MMSMSGGSMSKKRFKIVFSNLKRDTCDIQDTAQEMPTFYNDLGHISSVEPVCELLNQLNDENEQLQTELNNYEKITNLLADYDVHHYNRWINQIKNYVEKTNEGFEYNREFIIKLCLSYTLQSLRNGEDLKRFQWGMVNDE